MDIDQVKNVVDRINERKAERKRLNILKKVVDDRTTESGHIVISIEKEPFFVPAKDVKKLIDKSIVDLNDTPDITRLKDLVK